eukprot:242277_1
MIALIYLFTCIQIPTITWCKTIISNSSTTLSNQVIACPNEDICSVQCLSYRSCFGSIIHCNRATECIIHCMDIESCFVASIYQSSQNNQVIIDCHGPESCVYLNIYKESNNNDSSPNTSFALYAANEASAKGATIHDIISHSNYFIHCNSTRSCDGLSIAFNPLHIHNQSPSYNMHIACVSIEACKDIAIETLSEWDAHITTNNIVYEAFEIDISCVETLSCFDARFDFAHLLIDGTTNTNYGNVTIHCIDQDNACDDMTVICPDLYPFDAEYDYVYHQNDIRCHLDIQSYSKGFVMESKHGYDMVDITCNANDATVCDEVRLFCSEVQIGCTMKYNQSSWYCDHLGELYMFSSLIAYRDADEMRFHKYYGCNNFTWFSDTAVIKTSQIPQYDTITHQHIDCLSYNPHASACIVQCDTEHACSNTFIYCNQVEQCSIECDGDTTCKGSPRFYCPYNNDASDAYVRISSFDVNYAFFNPERTCMVSISPLSQPVTGIDTHITVDAVHNTSLVVLSDSSARWQIHDYGMRWFNWTIAGNIAIDSNISYYKERSFRVYNMVWWGNTDDVYFSIYCEFCYMAWLLLATYWNRSSVVDIHCVNCVRLTADIYGVSSTAIHCNEYQSNCDHLEVALVDYNLSIDCGPNCNGLKIDNTPHVSPLQSNYISHVYLAFHANQTQQVQIDSLYGFDYVDIYYDPSLSILPSIRGYCGYPDFFIDCGSNPSANTCGLNACTQPNPEYDDSLFVLRPAEYRDAIVLWNVVFCKGFYSCALASITCGTQCIIHCLGRFSCYIVNIHTNGNDLVLNCIGYKSCRSSEIIGTHDTANIEVNCKGLESCTNIKMDHSDAMYLTGPNDHGLNVTCHDPLEFTHVLPYAGDACQNMNIQCPSTPTSQQLIGTYLNSDIIQSKCHIDLTGNAVWKSQDIKIFHAFNGVTFVDLQCNRESCKYVHYFCANNTMQSEWIYDNTSNSLDCMGGCCDFINSEAPTNAPTAAPSRAPTIWAFGDTDYFEALFRVIFGFYTSNDLSLFLDVHTDLLEEPYSWIQNVLETGYLIADPMDNINAFDTFSVSVQSVSMEQTEQTALAYSINTQIWATTPYIDEIAGITEHDDDFQVYVEKTLNNTYNTDAADVQFEIIDVEKLENMNVDELPLNEGTVLSLIVTFLIFVVAFVGWVHSKKKVCFKETRDCDDTQVVSVMTYGMQIFDLYTDIAFLFELITKYQLMLLAGETKHIELLHSLWILSCVFIVLPYVSNIVNVIRLQRAWDMNQADSYTQTWFADNNKKFAAFVLASGSVFAALKLITSKLFGLSIFNAPISKYKVREMDSYKIYYNVLLESAPQFILQLIYIAYFNALSVTVVASTASSVFSILLSVVAFCMKQSNPIAHKKADALPRFYIDILNKVGDSDVDDKDKQMDADVEVKALYKRQGRRKKLASRIAKVFGFHKKSIEFVYSVEKQYGISLYGVCTSLKKGELSKRFDALQNELRNAVLATYNVPEKKWRVGFRFPDNIAASQRLLADAEDIVEMTNTITKRHSERVDPNQVDMSVGLHAHKSSQDKTKDIQSQSEPKQYQE